MPDPPPFFRARGSGQHVLPGGKPDLTTPQGRLGKWGKEHARRYLEGKGYKVSATNYRSRWGEVDIIAQLGEEMVFV
ncbi:MAG TPA: hypothetical protein EYM77_05580 [Dehalococcoidia bacterium]|nr:hypothetical protein [Dehalococcoidia bacterium]